MTIDDFAKNLDLDSDTFEEMKRNFNFVLQRLLGNMEEKQSREGSLTLKLDITLASEFIPNYDPEVQGETREIHKPSFKHKITSVVKINDEKSGNMDSEMELYMDENGVYKMKPIANTQQRSIFDADFREVEPEVAEGEVIETEENALPGRKVMSLPGPSAGGESGDSPEPEENPDNDTFIVEEENVAASGDNEAESDQEEDIMPLPFSEDDEYEYEEPEEE